MGLEIVERAGKIFFHHSFVCVCDPHGNCDDSFIFLIVSKSVLPSLLCSPTAMVPVCDLKVLLIAKLCLD